MADRKDPKVRGECAGMPPPLPDYITDPPAVPDPSLPVERPAPLSDEQVRDAIACPYEPYSPAFIEALAREVEASRAAARAVPPAREEGDRTEHLSDRDALASVVADALWGEGAGDFNDATGYTVRHESEKVADAVLAHLARRAALPAREGAEGVPPIVEVLGALTDEMVCECGVIHTVTMKPAAIVSALAHEGYIIQHFDSLSEPAREGVVVLDGNAWEVRQVRSRPAAEMAEHLRLRRERGEPVTVVLRPLGSAGGEGDDEGGDE